MSCNCNNLNSNDASDKDTHRAERIKRVSEYSDLSKALSHIVVMGHDSNSNAIEAFLQYAHNNNISLKQFWVIEDEHNNVVAACLAIPNTGRTSMMFTSNPHTSAQIDTLARLITHVSANLDRKMNTIAQAILSFEEQSILKAFIKAGYLKLANLSYLQRNVNAKVKGLSKLKWPEKVTVETFNPDNEIGFKEAIIASYENTLDCPDLCGLRDINDVIDGHKGTGIFNPTLWYLVRYDNTPAAVLLLNKTGAGLPKNDVELSYIGVGARFRGMGIGRILLQYGLTQLSEKHHNIHKITLAVDEDNKPALRLYKDFGFYKTDRRIALILSIK